MAGRKRQATSVPTTSATGNPFIVFQTKVQEELDAGFDARSKSLQAEYNRYMQERGALVSSAQAFCESMGLGMPALPPALPRGRICV
eukprot:COSAG01_NODE_35945_length_524_cov_1.327059_1_plen_86_part_10